MVVSENLSEFGNELFGSGYIEVGEEDEEYEEVPKWLTPVKTNVDFLNMEEGDGRNQSLFNYILTLQSSLF